ncbi:hypothetical protein BTVI_12023 [Pitangus sulphuratus]|nr:hypothetical protein BTVI_12023 [Pitangus sulphuratus]
MVSREPVPRPAPAGEGSQEKAMTVRSVLLNRDSPDIESRLKRRRNRTQQVRFKDLVEGDSGQAGSPPPGPAATPGPNTPRASPPPRDAPGPAALRASRRSWPQAQPGSLTLPMPRKACMSTAIQTSPSLQKPFPAPQPRSKSVCDVAGDADLLQLVVVAKGPPARDEDAQTSQGEGPWRPREQGDLHSQLQSLEGVLETSQQTIRVLLDVIQDLEKKEAQRDGRHSYRTGQDIANCGTCRDCACIIYSVEHDFRQQEGRFQRVLSHIEGDAGPSPTPTAMGLAGAAGAAGTTSPPRQELSPGPKLPVKLDVKKSRRKCFWFL